MFISQLTSTSALVSFILEKICSQQYVLPKRKVILFSWRDKLGYFSHTEFVKIYQTVFRICPLGFHISLQFNEFHLEIIRTVFHSQIKGLSKQFQFDFILSEIVLYCLLFTEKKRVRCNKKQTPFLNTWKHSQACSWETEKTLRLSSRYSLKSVNLFVNSSRSFCTLIP